ncbi:chitotriosidase-1-like [Saccoglossus kowalevskii]
MSCLPGTVFNPAGYCDWPDNVLGCSESPPETGETGETDCATSPSGLYRNPNDCNKYIQCANGYRYDRNCGPGTVFNPQCTCCDWAYNVDGCN